MPIKNKILFVLMLLGSGFFLYQGFSILFHPENKETQDIQDANNS